MEKLRQKLDFDRRYAAMETWVYSVTPIAVGNVVFKMKAPKQVAIRDPVLGFLEKCGWIGLIIFFIYELAIDAAYELEALPDANPNIFFERGTFNFYRNLSPFNEAAADKRVDYCTKATNSDAVYAFNEASPYNKVVCRQLNFAEVTKKGVGEAFLMTYQREVYTDSKATCPTGMNFEGTLATGRTPFDIQSQTSTAPTFPSNWRCNDKNIREVDVSLSTILPKLKAKDSDGKIVAYESGLATDLGVDWFTTFENADNEKSCACLERRNFVAVAPEYVDIRFSHAFTTSKKFDYVSGNSIEKNTKPGARNPRTYLKAKNGRYVDVSVIKAARAATTCQGSVNNGCHPELVYTDDKSKALYLAGDDKNQIQLPVQTLLEIAGIKLDENGKNKIPRRLDGVILNLDLVYDIKSGDSGHADCDLEVSHVDGEVSWNMDPQMHASIQASKPNTKFVRKYSEILNKGILIRISAKGRVYRFDWGTLLNVLVQSAVLLPGWTAFLIMIGTTLLGERSKMYKASLEEKLVYEHETAKYAAQAAIAAHMFSAADKTHEHGLTEEDIVGIFTKCKGVKAATAKQLARDIMHSCDDGAEDGDGDGVVELKEWVNHCCSDVCSWEHFEFPDHDTQAGGKHYVPPANKFTAVRTSEGKKHSEASPYSQMSHRHNAIAEQKKRVGQMASSIRTNVKAVIDEHTGHPKTTGVVQVGDLESHLEESKQ
jgi:hypothetical protein